MGDAKVLGRQPIGCGCRINKGRIIIITDQACVATVLHHDDENMLEVRETIIGLR